jgi:hypothetical protein
MDADRLVTQASRSPIADVCDAKTIFVATMHKRYGRDATTVAGA